MLWTFFIELEKFSLENTIKKQALDNLEKVINPQLVFDIYNKIKKKRRGLNHSRLEQYFSKHLLLMYDVLSTKDIDKTRVLREYLMALLARRDYPTSLIKDGSAIELYIDFKRTTEDIDAHINKKSISNLFSLLNDKQQIIYFEIKNYNNVNDNKTIISYQLKAKSRKKINELIKDCNEIKLTLNTTYDQNQIDEMIKDYSITKRNLKLIPNAYALVFTREMLLDEKYQSLISKNKDSTRTKDLIDLVNLYNEGIDFNKFLSWLFRKWNNNSCFKLNEKEVIEFIKTHKDIELIKIKNNFKDACKMYNTELSYKEAINIYNDISNKILLNS